MEIPRTSPAYSVNGGYYSCNKNAVASVSLARSYNFIYERDDFLCSDFK